MKITHHVLILEAETFDGIDDVRILLATDVAIVTALADPSVCVLDEAETGHHDQEHFKEPFHDCDCNAYTGRSKFVDLKMAELSSNGEAQKK